MLSIGVGTEVKYSNIVKNYRRKDEFGGFNIKTFVVSKPNHRIIASTQTVIKYIGQHNFSELVNIPSVQKYARKFNPELLV